ncbi:hypothetical protein TrRE_jg10516 [Triparma retinervis]|uniref:OTU domain-containing protein n=1 Tax=Triparma retinervis TaxID=2557542 RepID=A0A9W7AJM0_9STRA|nr:hypothetical protein TrRE_jg10516 [Triparma retinervis]
MAKKRKSTEHEEVDEEDTENTPSSYYCSHCDTHHTLTSASPTQPFTKTHGFTCYKVNPDGDCFYNCLIKCLKSDATYMGEMGDEFSSMEELTVKFMRGFVASKLTELQFESYKLQAEANMGESWLDFFRVGDLNQSEVDDNDSDDNASDSDFEIPSGKPSDYNTFSANSDSSETNRGSRYKARESRSSTQGYIKRLSSFRIKTLDDLRVFARGEGKTYGPNESLWADNYAYEVIAKYFRLDLLFIDHARKIGETPYRVLARGKDGERESIRYVVLSLEGGHFSAFMYSNSDNGVKGKPRGTFTLKDEKEPDVIKKLWGVGEVGVPGNQVEGIWYVYSGIESFVNDHELTEVTFAKGVTTIGKEAFIGCSSLMAITIPDGVTIIGEGTFSECSSLTAITIPDGVTMIREGAFIGCPSLTAITIPDSVTTIADNAFRGCSSLTAITIPDGVTEIGNFTFFRCSSLTAVTIPDGVTSIGPSAFRGCSALAKLSLSPAVSINDHCFLNCTALIAAAADRDMPTVSDLLHYRWHRNVAVKERVNALLCLKGTWDHVENQPSGQDSLKRKRTDGVEGRLKRTEARDKIPKVLWRVILEFL